MHLGCSIGLAMGGRASHQVLDGVGRYSGGITFGEADICFQYQSLDAGRAERQRGRHAGSPEQDPSHS